MLARLLGCLNWYGQLVSCSFVSHTHPWGEEVAVETERSLQNEGSSSLPGVVWSCRETVILLQEHKVVPAEPRCCWFFAYSYLEFLADHQLTQYAVPLHRFP